MSEVTSQHSRTPQESAEFLAQSLQDNTRALEAVRRRSRWMIAVIAALVLVVGLVIKFDHDGDVNQCKTANDVRTEIDEKWQAITDFLILVSPPDSADGEKFYALLSEDLDKSDCDSIGWLRQ